MLLLWGGRDLCFNRHFFVEWRYRFAQAESRYFVNAGHYLLEDSFAEIAPLMVDFFKRNLKRISDDGRL